jgi:hypothetical protein
MGKRPRPLESRAPVTPWYLPRACRAGAGLAIRNQRLLGRSRRPSSTRDCLWALRLAPGAPIPERSIPSVRDPKNAARAGYPATVTTPRILTGGGPLQGLASSGPSIATPYRLSYEPASVTLGRGPCARRSRRDLAAELRRRQRRDVEVALGGWVVYIATARARRLVGPLVVRGLEPRVLQRGPM